MSSKRQATSDLNHDNWDREEEPEERGTFRTASENELKNRVIKKVKRKITPGAGSDTTDGSPGTKSVFTHFSGFGKPAAATASSSPFSFLSKIPAIAAGTAAASGTVSTTTTSTSATPTFSFDSGLAVTTASTKTTESSKLSSISNFSFGNASSTTASSATAISPIATSQSSPYPFSSSEYYKKLGSLNQAVSEWIKTHVDKNPVCILSPIFKDYDKYLREIEDEKKKDEIKASTIKSGEKEVQSSPGVGSLKFSSSTSTTTGLSSNTSVATSTTETATKTNGFSFGIKKLEDTPQASKPTTAPTFSFGLESSTTTATSTAAPTTGFSFGNLTNNTNPSSSPLKPFSFTSGATPFSFGNIKPPAADVAATTSEANDEDEQPPKNEFKQVVEDDAVYSKKCKVFVKKDGSFVDKGVGTLYLKPVESTGKTQLLVRADTNLGNILVNLILNSAIPAQRMGKNNVMMVCLPTPDVEKPISMLLRVKTGEEADELLENIDKYKK